MLARTALNHITVNLNRLESRLEFATYFGEMLPSPDENPEVLEWRCPGSARRRNSALRRLESFRERARNAPQAVRMLDLQDADDVDALLVQVRIDEIDEQIRLLEEEAKISRFVEDTVKFSYEVRRLNDG